MCEMIEIAGAPKGKGHALTLVYSKTLGARIVLNWCYGS